MPRGFPAWVIVAAVVLVPVGIAITVTAWSECLTEHSFWFCVAALSK
jgi:hypothetical protein